MKLTEPEEPALKVCEPVKAIALAPVSWMVIEEAPPPVSETVPVPASVRAPVERNCMVAADLVVVMVPELVRVEPLTFIVMLPVAARVTLLLTLVAADVVVVTGPPLRFNVVVLDPLDLANVRV